VKKKPMPSLEAVRASRGRQIELLVGIKMELDRALEDFAQAHDAGVQAYKSGMGKFGSRSTNFRDQAPEAGYEFHRLQGACSFAAGLIRQAERDLAQADRRLERASTAILNAWLDTDPEVGRERRAIRAAATQSLTPNPKDGILPASRNP
jgi:hypothetical protein